MVETYAAIDIGAESGRVVVGALTGSDLTVEEVHRFRNVTVRMGDGLHWDLDNLWRNVVAGMRAARDWSELHGGRLASVGVDTWGVDYGLLDEAGELLGAPFCYRDDRTAAVFEDVIADVGRERLYARTGIQFMPLNTVFQLAAHCRNDPEMLRRAKRMLFVPDLLHYMLTGRPTVEATIASTSQMIDVRTGRWAGDLLESIGIPTEMLSPLVEPGTMIGQLLPEVELEVGAEGAVEVITPAAHDTASAVAAVPADELTDWCFLSSGTWSLLGAELDEPCVTRDAMDAPFTNERGLEGRIRFLKNITGLWLVQECRRSLADSEDSVDYEELVSRAADAQPFRTLVDTDYRPLLSPGRMTEKIGQFADLTGQPRPADPGQFVRCCLESLALTYRRVLMQLERVLDRRFDVLHIVGGGGRNRLLNQMTADATGRRVVVGPYEAAAIGNILVQAMGRGLVGDAPSIRRLVRANFDLEVFLPGETAVWDDACGRFGDLLDRSAG